jgi:hypothetical protein
MAGTRCIQPAKWVNGTPDIRSGVYKDAETWTRGALLVLDSDGLITECGSDPADVVGVALEANDTRPGYDMANSPTVITGRKQEVLYAVANTSTVFSMRGVNGGTDPSTPAQTNIGESYGALADGAGIWTLDLSETSAKVFTIVDVDVDQKVFFCVFVAAVLQTPLPSA